MASSCRALSAATMSSRTPSWSAGNPRLKDGAGAILLGAGRLRHRHAVAVRDRRPVRDHQQRFLGAGQEPGLKYGNWSVGPEAILLGNVSFDEARFGGFVKYDLSRKKSLQWLRRRNPQRQFGARQQRRQWRRDAGLRALSKLRVSCTICQVMWVRRRTAGWRSIEFAEPDSQVRNSLIRHLSILAGLFRAIPIPSRRNFKAFGALRADRCSVAKLQQSDLFANISAAGRKPRRTSGGRQ
jgi:hypothetical protein